MPTITQAEVLRRGIRLAQLLAERPRRSRDLAHELDVDLRTVDRLLADLRTVGIAVETEVRHRERYHALRVIPAWLARAVKIVGRLAVVAALVTLAGCGPTYNHGWQLTGAPVPDAFAHEVEVAAEVIRAQEGVLHREWGGEIRIEPAPFPCPDGMGLCAGWTDVAGSHHTITIAYDEAVGLGPEVGTTAIIWELCNAARYLRTCGQTGLPNLFRGACDGQDDPSVARCAAEARPKVIAALTIP